ncbi:very short patch repair endonuclease [Nocardioides sp. NPDC057772]|uniref:very short patch repair endonuclease n=1 Tax=Nocardioides sp. NPDC057772 TaxID=3346245 RepID=UPI00366CCF45
MVAERWVPTDASPSLSGRRSTNTGPEMALRRALHALGVRFRLHRRLAPACTPDIVLPGRRVAVWVDGCYWHSCPEHGRTKPFTGPNSEMWRAKMERTRDRDARAVETAEALGWAVVRIWEHDIRHDAVSAARLVLAASSADQTHTASSDTGGSGTPAAYQGGRHPR